MKSEAAELLAKLIHAALLADSRVSAQHIEVSVDDGMVTLTGIVQSYRRKLAAQQIARDFEGVRDIENRLFVEPDSATPDDAVANHVRASLDAHADITKEAITVAVASGRAKLFGSVGSRWERTLAEDITRSVRGVRDVVNLLVVNPFEMASDEQLSQQIVAAMSHARGLGEADIQVAVSDAAVVLSGAVEQLWQKETAQSVAERFRPLRLENQIIVEGNSIQA